MRLTPTGRSVVASAPALGAGDRGFESLRPDQNLFHLQLQGEPIEERG